MKLYLELVATGAVLAAILILPVSYFVAKLLMREPPEKKP